MRIDHHDLAGALDRRRKRGHQADRPRAVNDDRLARQHASQCGGVVTGRKDVGQHHIIVFFFLGVGRQLQAVEVGIRNAQVFGLAAPVQAHAGKTVGCARRAGIGGQAKAGQSALAALAEAAADVEGQADPVADLDPVNRAAHFDDFAEIFTAQDAACFHIGAAFIHVQVGAANIGHGDLDQHIDGRSILASGMSMARTSRGPW